VSHGFVVLPYTELYDSNHIPHSGTFVTPSGIAPAARNRATTVASEPARRSLRARQPNVSGMPSTAIISFTVNGTPSSGRSGPPPSPPRGTAPRHARLETLGDHRVEASVHCLDPADVRVHRLQRSDRAAPDQRGQTAGRNLHQFIIAHDRILAARARSRSIGPFVALTHPNCSWRETMLWTIVLILVVLWLLGLVSGTTVGGLVHLLLVIAIIVVLIRVISGRRAVYLCVGPIDSKGSRHRGGALSVVFSDRWRPDQ
jgi:hypothetical protein